MRRPKCWTIISWTKGAFNASTMVVGDVVESNSVLAKCWTTTSSTKGAFNEGTMVVVDVVESKSVLTKSKAFDLDDSEIIWKVKLYFDSTIIESVAETPAGATSFVDGSLLD